MLPSGGGGAAGVRTCLRLLGGSLLRASGRRVRGDRASAMFRDPKAPESKRKQPLLRYLAFFPGSCFSRPLPIPPLYLPVATP